MTSLKRTEHCIKTCYVNLDIIMYQIDAQRHPFPVATKKRMRKL